MKQRNIGLARALSKLGYCSRSNAAELIRAGRVTLNGRTRRDPETPTHLDSDHIAVDGGDVRAAPFIYLMLNKPRGIVTTASDERHRETVYSLLAPGTPFVGPVGRLDKASEGLLLMTNDSEWAARVTAPESHLDKRYHVQVRCDSVDAVIARLQEGVSSRGELLRVKAVSVLRHGRVHAWFEIVIEEGRNRHIRRMFEELAIEVQRLVRVAIGPLELGDLQKGAVRPLTAGEKSAMNDALSLRLQDRR
jgi:23S rRNA pseudouridine2605 synthase